MIRVPTRKDLYALLPAGGIGAELGVLLGENATDLLSLAKPRRLHLVDRWQPYIGGRIDDHGQPEAFAVDGPDAMRAVETRFNDALAAGVVTLHQTDTVAWLAAQPASSLDWCYLDSDHGEPHVYRELCQAYRVVRAGGWICGHDYCAVFGGCVAAVDRFCREHGQRLHVVTNEDELPVTPSERERLPWLPSAAACNSVAIVVEK
jgi:hypothetical protein